MVAKKKSLRAPFCKNKPAKGHFPFGEKLRLHEMIKIHPPFSIRSLAGPGRRSADRPRQGPREGPRGQFVHGPQEKIILPKKLKAAEPGNSPVRPGGGGVPIYNVQSIGGAD